MCDLTFFKASLYKTAFYKELGIFVGISGVENTPDGLVFSCWSANLEKFKLHYSELERFCL